MRLHTAVRLTPYTFARSPQNLATLGLIGWTCFHKSNELLVFVGFCSGRRVATFINVTSYESSIWLYSALPAGYFCAPNAVTRRWQLTAPLAPPTVRISIACIHDFVWTLTSSSSSYLSVLRSLSISSSVFFTAKSLKSRNIGNNFRILKVTKMNTNHTYDVLIYCTRY